MRIGSLRAMGRQIDPEHPERGRRLLAEAVRRGELRVRPRGRAYLVALEDVERWWRSGVGPVRGEDEAFVARRLEREEARQSA